jgi:serine/threonine-protein kinase PknG
VLSATTARPLPTTGHGSGAAETALPVVSLPPPTSAIQRDPRIRESHRRCAGCGEQLDQPANEGRCPACDRPFSFSPKLRTGDRVAGQYEVLGCIAHGGFGWIYLAADRNLDKHVVLKGLIDTGDATAARLAVAESRVLAASEHLNIVRIYNVVTHPDPHAPGERNRYIVMDFVRGVSLHDVLLHHAAELRAEHVANYGREILAALGYLHEQNLLYCDLSPQNVIQGEKLVKVIDLGAIRETGDRTSPVVGIDRYQVGEAEFAEHGLTVRSDIYALGVVLTDLLNASPHGVRPPRELEFGVASLRRVLERATSGYGLRYASTAEMAAQLDGVLAELHSLRDNQPRPPVASLFVDGGALLDAGLGQPPALDRWLDAEPPGFDAGRPSAPVAAALLPVPLPAPDSEVEAHLRRGRQLIGRADPVRAAASLELAKAALSGEPQRDWRILWHGALLELARGDLARAEELFDEVCWYLPGEPAPKLALGFCAESRGRAHAAEQRYAAVWARDRSQAGAAFGLARVAAAGGDRARAVAVLDGVPEASRHHDSARVAAIRLLAATLPAGGGPTAADLAAVAERLDRLYLDGEESRDRLTTLVREAELAIAEPARRRELAAALAESYRKLARQARNRNEHGVLVDLANATRPRTRFEMK